MSEGINGRKATGYMLYCLPSDETNANERKRISRHRVIAYLVLIADIIREN